MSTANIDIRLSNGKQAGQTINELRQQANRLTKEINNLKPGTDEFIKKSADLKQVGGRLGDLRKEVKGTTQANNSLVQSFTAYLPFSSQLSTINNLFKLNTISLKGFRAALMATGIGAIVVLLGSLVSYLTSTQAGMDKVTAVTRPLLAVFQKMKGVLQELGGSVFKGLAQILNGDFKEGLKTLGSGFVDVISNTKEAIKGGIEAGTKLDTLQKQIEKTENALITKRAELNRKYQESKEIAQDQSRTDAERKKAAQEAYAAQNELLQAEQEFLDLKIEKTELQHSLNDTSRADAKELKELEAERINFEAAAAKKRASAKSLENTVDREIATERKKRTDAEQKRHEAAEAAKLKATQERLKAELAAQQSIDELRIAVMQEGIDKEIAQIALDTERKIEALIGSEEQIREQKALLLEQEELRKAEVRDTYLEKEVEAQKKAADKIQAIKQELASYEEQIETTRRDVFAGTADFLADVVENEGKNSQAARDIRKGVALFEIGMSLTEKLNAIDIAALKIAALAPPVSLATAATYKTTQTIGAIASTAFKLAQLRKFEKGGLLQGNRHYNGGIAAMIMSTGEPVELEGGEFVFSRKAVAGIGADVLSNINRKFETGGPVNPINTPGASGISQAADSSKELVAEFRSFRGEVATWQRNLRVHNSLQSTKAGIDQLSTLEAEAAF